MPTGIDYQRQLLAQMLMGNNTPSIMAQSNKDSFIHPGFLSDWIGQGLGALFGNGPNNAINFGGGNQFIPGQGFMQRAYGPPTAGGDIPMAPGFDFKSFFNGLF